MEPEASLSLFGRLRAVLMELAVGALCLRTWGRKRRRRERWSELQKRKEGGRESLKAVSLKSE